ncbi:MAG TPA: dienelactone hydrolase family protein [Anaerolineales bacterium]|nr:dienelactone hydrolase family protein [Anaerolineales bacterium]
MNDFQRYLAEEFVEDYAEGRMTRREALKLIASVTGSFLLANTLLAACELPPAQSTSTTSPTTTPAPDTAEPAATPTSQPVSTQSSATATPAPASPTVVGGGTVSPDDPAVIAGPVEFPGEGATLVGYLARPNVEGAFPVVLVCHENRGLTNHIRDVTRRLAKAGYVALAVDLLSRQGGTDVVGSSQVPGALGNTPPDQFVQDFVSGWQYLQTQPFAQADRVGMVGFCFGGGVTWRVATQMPELKAAVPFYGPSPSVSDVPNINAAVLAIYGELDTRINQGVPAIEAAMQQNNKVYEKVIYPNADHAFHNDTGSRYNAEAARDAWARVLAWFAKYL